MKQLVIEKNKIQNFIKQLTMDYDVFGPVKNNDIFLFKQIKNPEELFLDYTNSKIPPKSLFLLQTETLFKFSTDGNVRDDTSQSSKQRLIFGIRPCDAYSLKILDKVRIRPLRD